MSKDGANVRYELRGSIKRNRRVIFAMLFYIIKLGSTQPATFRTEDSINYSIKADIQDRSKESNPSPTF